METRRGRFDPRRAFSEVPPIVKWLIYLSSFNSVSYGYLFILIPGYLAEPEIGLSGADVGLLVGLMGLSFAVLAIPVGLLADRKGRRWLLVVGMIGSSPLLFVFSLTQEMPVLMMASVAMGAVEVTFMATWNALIADLTTQEKRPAAFAMSFVVGTITFGLGFALPGVFPWLESYTGWSSYSVHMGTLMLFAVLSFVSGIGMWLLLRDVREEIHPGERAISEESLGLLVKFSGINSLIGLGAGFIIPLIPTWFLYKFGAGDEFSGPLLMISSVSMGLAAFASTPIAKRYGMIPAIVLTQSLSTIFMFSLAFADMVMFAAVLYLVRASLMNMGIPLLDALLMGIVRKEERGVASAVNAVVWRLPNSATAIVGGILLKSGEYSLPFFLATACYIVGIALFFSLFRNVKPKS